MRILTILGTRPEVIRLSRVIPKLDATCDHKILHTGQNYDYRLNGIFFSELGLRCPDKVLDIRGGTLGEQLGKIYTGVEEYIKEISPDKVLILGDTNTGLAAIICERYGIPVYHMEAGNRCFDLRVPEEKNRKVIDAISTVNMPYTRGSAENLYREGVARNRVFTIGNPIGEVLEYYRTSVDASTVVEDLELQPGKYVLATAHREENVDDAGRLTKIFAALSEIAGKYEVIFSCHPRTRLNLKKWGIANPGSIKLCEPFGFFDFVKLERDCLLGITDSGTVQEELCLLGRPTITIRDTTERPETVECGSNVVCGVESKEIIATFNRWISRPYGWKAPDEYLKADVSGTVVNIVLGKL